jgi:TamB, inner membrane protein subunit of TAM complex
MHLVRGHYFFLSNRFTLTEADLTFDNQQGVDPLMTIVAQTKLRPSTGGLYGGRWDEGHMATIAAQISGRASQPVIALTSPEGLDQTEILRELTYGRFRSDDGGAWLAGFSTDPLENYVTRQLTNQLSRDLSKYLNNAITQWTVEREQGALFGASGQGDVYVGVSGDVNDNTSWTYRQRVPGFDRGTSTLESATQFERDVAVEYRVNRFIYVTTELTQRRTSVTQSRTSTGGAAEFNMNLKARWEY